VVLTDDGAPSFRRASLPHLRDVRELSVRPLGSDELTAAERITIALLKGFAGSDA
jgi:hypothetical protein